MKKTWIAVILLIGIFLFPVPAQAAPEGESEAVFSLQDTLVNLDLQSLEEFKGRIDGEMNPFLQSKPLKEWLGDFVQGKWEF